MSAFFLFSSSCRNPIASYIVTKLHLCSLSFFKRIGETDGHQLFKVGLSELCTALSGLNGQFG